MLTLPILPILSVFPLAGSIFVISLAIYIYIGQRGSRINGSFAFFSFLIFVWLFATAMLLISKEDVVIIFWERIIYSSVVFIPAVIYQFSTFFLPTSYIQRLFIAVGYVLSVFFLYTTIFTEGMISGVYHYSWGSHAVAQKYHNVFLIFFGIYLLLMFVNLIRAYLLEKERENKNRVAWIFLALVTLSFSSFSFLPAYHVNVYPLTYIPGIAFVAIVAYAIAQNNLFRNRGLIIHLFILFIVLVTFLEILTASDVWELFLRLVFFCIVVFFSYLIIKNVKTEIQRREEFQKLSEKLQVVNERLVRLDKAKSDMLSVAAHQLRTPLTAMNGYLSLIVEGATGEAVGEKTQEMITKVSRATMRLSALVNNLLNMSRIDDERMQYVMRPTQIEEIVRETAETFDILAREKGLQFVVDIPETPLPPVVIDDNKMHEVISNLINNAIKYTKEGRITVRVWQHNPTHVRFSVADTGVGIPKDVESKLFSKFSRADKHQLNTEGAGIGLYVCYNIVHDHGGRIWVESEGDGKGAEFIVELSTQTDAQKAAQEREQE